MDPSTLNPQPSTLNPQPPTPNVQPLNPTPTLNPPHPSPLTPTPFRKAWRKGRTDPLDGGGHSVQSERESFSLTLSTHLN